MDSPGSVFLSKEIKASKEHIELSTFIKNVHKKLRHDAKVNGWKETWSKHCNDTETLKQYAASMQDLACKHWQENQQKENSKALSRITWVHDKCQEYFESGISKARQQEDEIANKCGWVTDDNILEVTGRLCLLDVGSCYNPFQRYKDYDVVAIDIAPSNEDVLQCDFLNVQISEKSLDKIEEATTNNKRKREATLTTLVKHSFHVIVFSLLLDYFPSPELRLECCKNAYELLQFEGILIVISPDAKHVGANAKYMKSWRLVLANIGFRRIVYEKLPYLHCMVFRKCRNLDVAKRWASLHQDDKLFDQMYVPQDFN